MPLRVLAAALVLALAASGPVAAKSPKPLRLYAMDCGTIVNKDTNGYADDGAYAGVATTMIVPCYLIRHPKGDLIWDTGLPQSLADRTGPSPDGVTVTRKLTDQLQQLGLKPADIEYLSVSHSHFDHIGNAGLFAASTWIVDAEERAYAFRPAARKGQGFAAYSALENAKTILIEGDAPYDVFGDGSVTIHQAPGHTPGHTVLLVRLRDAGPVLLTGDMWHVAASRAARRVPRFNVDRAQTLRSTDYVEKLAADTHALVIREHVIEDFTALPKFPKGLR